MGGGGVIFFLGGGREEHEIIEGSFYLETGSKNLGQQKARMCPYQRVPVTTYKRTSAHFAVALFCRTIT